MTLTVTLFLVMITGLSAADTDNSQDLPVYNDTCEYTAYIYGQEKCGDKCVEGSGYCHCGNYTSEPYEKVHCCIPSDSTCDFIPETDWDEEVAVCSQGVKIPISSQCNNSARSLQCHNPYQDSQEIGLYSHFTCPDRCVSVYEEMCRGVNWCSNDVQACGPQLRCEDLTKPLLSSLAKEHHYCANRNDFENNKGFDSLDRSDEKNFILSVADGTSYDIDDTDFKACESYGFTGLTCGSDCLSKPGGWCRGRVKPIPCGPKNISTTDKRLCGNPLVFAKDPCLNFYSNPDGTKTIKAYGRHTVRKKDSP